MKRNFFRLIAAVLVASLSLISCTNELTGEDQPVKGYHISIPAHSASTKAIVETGDGGISCVFKTTENVYVYNISSETWDDGVLHPASEGTSTVFSGDLNNPYSADQTIRVFYNTDSEGVVDYSGQDGSYENVKDAGVGEATISTVSDDVITTNETCVENLQSIFRFIFKDGTTPLENVISVVISSVDGKLVSTYDAQNETDTPGSVVATSSEGRSAFYVALRFAPEASGALVFQVVTADGKVYSGSKSAPDGGYQNGKFYKDIKVAVTPHVFSVSDSKQVYIAPGNLGKDGDTYSFLLPYANWGYDSTGSPDDLTKTAYFKWKKAVDNAPYTIYGIEDWTILSKDEWDYLTGVDEISPREMNTDVERLYIVKTSGKLGVIITPDGATASDVEGLTPYSNENKYNDVNYLEYVAKGFAFLEACGGYNSGWSNDDQIFSWTSTEKNSTNKYFIRVRLNPNPDLQIAYGQSRYYPVRLVHTVF